MQTHKIKPYEVKLPPGQEFLTIPQSKQRFGGGRMQRIILRYSLIMTKCNNKTVLDAGYGNGIGLSMLSMIATKAFGIDRKADSFKFAKGLTYYCPTTLVKLDLKDLLKIKQVVPKVDICILCDVLEHVTFPTKLMQDAASITKELIFGNIPVNTPGKYHVNVYSIEEIIDLVTNALGGHIIFLGIKGRTITPIKKCLRENKKINNVFFTWIRENRIIKRRSKRNK